MLRWTIASGLWLFAMAFPVIGAAQSGNNMPPGRTLDPQQQAFGKLIDQYATIAGGWFLEQQCHDLTPDGDKEFDWNVEQTNIALSRRVPVTMLRQIQSSAQQTAAKYPCDAKAKSIVDSTVAMSRQTTLTLTGQRYSAEAQKADNRNKIVVLLKAQKADDRCKMMPPDVRKEFDDRTQRIVSGFSKDPNEIARLNAESAFPSAPCDVKVRSFLMDTLAQARQMSGN